MTDTLNVDPVILTYATRYALGRATYALADGQWRTFAECAERCAVNVKTISRWASRLSAAGTVEWHATPGGLHHYRIRLQEMT